MDTKKVGLRLAFGCQKRVGKDTSCEYMQKKYGGHILSFATPLYEIMNMTQKKLNLPQKKNREFLQTVGMWAHSQNENIWVDYLVNQLNQIPVNENVFISDVRFKNEMRALKDREFTLIRIKRNNDLAEDTHISENELINAEWDREIDNNGSLDNLFFQLDMLA
jgi:hypothetical protein